MLHFKRMDKKEEMGTIKSESKSSEFGQIPLENMKPSVSQEEVHDLIFSREIGWKEVIYDLINTEQLDPWNIDIQILTEKYLEKISELEEADFFVSSKVLLAASLLLRIKSEILLNSYIKSIDEILFGKKEVKKYELERIELDEEIPDLVPRSPIPRYKKVTLKELMEALNKAITTENRRIKKEIIKRNALREVSILIPKKTISIKNKIKEILEKVTGHLEKGEKRKLGFNSLVGENREEKISSFYPLLQLENQKKVWLEQENHFEEFHIWLHKTYMKHNPNPFEELKKELEEEIKRDLEKEERKNNRSGKKINKRVEKINKKFKNPLGDMFD